MEGPPPPPPGAAFRKLSKWGFAPTLILDVGANVGDWSKAAWRQWGGSTPAPTLLLVEGSPRRVDALASTGWPFLISVVGASTREVPFFDSPVAHTGNSVLKENGAWFKDVDATTTVQRTLDELVAGYVEDAGVGELPPPPWLLKMDVQGYELEVMKGAASVLKNVECIMMEVSIVQYNSGAPLVAAVFRALDEAGFQAVDRVDELLVEDVLIQLDFAFVRKGSPLLAVAMKAARLT